ncbi:MAG: hypothetical protein QM756_34515 [Polyangiaceae bacterium]
MTARRSKPRACSSTTQVRAPINGVTGVRFVDAGNLVRASDATGLVVISSSMGRQLPSICRRTTWRASTTPRRTARYAITVSNRDGTEKLGEGTLSLVDNQVNSATATVRLKALVPNTQRLCGRTNS